MSFKTLKPVSLRDQFVKEIERMILSEELKVGQKLPVERELARQMNLSVSVVNSGISELKRLGFLKIVPRHGVYVDDYIQNGNLDTMNAIFDYAGEKLDRETIDSLLDFCVDFDAVLVRKGVDHQTSEDLEKMAGIVEDMKKCPDPHEFGQLCFEFYHVMALSTDNTIYPLLLTSFRSLYVALYEISVHSGFYEDSVKAFETILDNLRRSDKEGAVHYICDEYIPYCRQCFEKMSAEEEKAN